VCVAAPPSDQLSKPGEAVTVTVNGRPVALLVPIDRDPWRRWEDIVDILAGSSDEDWARDRELVDEQLGDRFHA
jgi:antitoxin (DNA-binding transcriptional repressor) of toxin-antitoxin stability system